MGFPSLIKSLKLHLRVRDLTYADTAAAIGISEAMKNCSSPRPAH